MNRTALVGMVSLVMALGTLAGAGCASPTEDAKASSATSSEEVRADSFTFFHKSPMASAAVEAVRVDQGVGDFNWVANQSTVASVQMQSSAANAALDGRNTKSLTQRAFGFVREGARIENLRVVAETDRELALALEGTGLYPDMESDAEATAEHARRVALIARAAKEDGVTILRGELTDQPDMYWEGVLVLFDTKNREVVFVTGGYGT